MHLLELTVCLLGVISLALVKGQGQQSEEESALTVTLYYESYCPDCIRYIGDELLDAWRTFNDKIQVDLVPFGNARQSYIHGHFKFTCQHGPKECLANKLHACAILQACGQGGTVSCGSADKLNHVINFIHCLEQQPDQLQATTECAANEQLDADGIVKCAQNNQGDLLLSLYGNRTAAFRPKIEYVPTVAINGNHDKAAEDDLVGEICKLRPSLCSYHNSGTNRIPVIY